MTSVQERRMIGPHEAAEILEYNKRNRKVDTAKVHFYARQMREGRWRDTGIPIIIFRQGSARHLDDGQHRLLAIIECGMTFPLTISVVDERVVDVVDQNKVRSLGDLFTIESGTSEGVTYKRAAAVGIAVDLWQRNRMGNQEYAQYSVGERKELLEKYPRQAAIALDFVQRYKRAHKRLPHAGCIAGVLSVHRASDNAERFVQQILLAETDATVQGGSSMIALFKLCANPPEVIHGQFPVIARTWNNWVVNAWDRRHERNVVSLAESRHWFEATREMPEIADDDEEFGDVSVS